ncbi:unnamed protein product [Amoebophrya sp. A25]|nr:unnamed protein product [Amoebophrya sp. A25]|eukprot:GSA25T00001170001.1
MEKARLDEVQASLLQEALNAKESVAELTRAAARLQEERALLAETQNSKTVKDVNAGTTTQATKTTSAHPSSVVGADAAPVERRTDSREIRFQEPDARRSRSLEEPLGRGPHKSRQLAFKHAAEGPEELAPLVDENAANRARRAEETKRLEHEVARLREDMTRDAEALQQEFKEQWNTRLSRAREVEIDPSVDPSSTAHQASSSSTKKSGSSRQNAGTKDGASRTVTDDDSNIDKNQPRTAESSNNSESQGREGRANEAADEGQSGSQKKSTKRPQSMKVLESKYDQLQKQVSRLLGEEREVENPVPELQLRDLKSSDKVKHKEQRATTRSRHHEAAERFQQRETAVAREAAPKPVSLVAGGSKEPNASRATAPEGSRVRRTTTGAPTGGRNVAGRKRSRETSAGPASQSRNGSNSLPKLGRDDNFIDLVSDSPDRGYSRNTTAFSGASSIQKTSKSTIQNKKSVSLADAKLHTSTRTTRKMTRTTPQVDVSKVGSRLGNRNPSWVAGQNVFAAQDLGEPALPGTFPVEESNQALSTPANNALTFSGGDDVNTGLGQSLPSEVARSTFQGAPSNESHNRYVRSDVSRLQERGDGFANNYPRSRSHSVAPGGSKSSTAGMPEQIAEEIDEATGVANRSSPAAQAPALQGPMIPGMHPDNAMMSRQSGAVSYISSKGSTAGTTSVRTAAWSRVGPADGGTSSMDLRTHPGSPTSPSAMVASPASPPGQGPSATTVIRGGAVATELTLRDAHRMGRMVKSWKREVLAVLDDVADEEDLAMDLLRARSRSPSPPFSRVGSSSQRSPLRALMAGSARNATPNADGSLVEDNYMNNEYDSYFRRGLTAYDDDYKRRESSQSPWRPKTTPSKASPANVRYDLDLRSDKDEQSSPASPPASRNSRGRNPVLETIERRREAWIERAEVAQLREQLFVELEDIEVQREKALEELRGHEQRHLAQIASRQEALEKQLRERHRLEQRDRRREEKKRSARRAARKNKEDAKPTREEFEEDIVKKLLSSSADVVAPPAGWTTEETKTFTAFPETKQPTPSAGNGDKKTTTRTSSTSSTEDDLLSDWSDEEEHSKDNGNSPSLKQLRREEEVRWQAEARAELNMMQQRLQQEIQVKKAKLESDFRRMKAESRLQRDVKRGRAELNAAERDLEQGRGKLKEVKDEKLRALQQQLAEQRELIEEERRRQEQEDRNSSRDSSRSSDTPSAGRRRRGNAEGSVAQRIEAGATSESSSHVGRRAGSKSRDNSHDSVEGRGGKASKGSLASSGGGNVKHYLSQTQASKGKRISYMAMHPERYGELSPAVRNPLNAPVRAASPTYAVRGQSRERKSMLSAGGVASGGYQPSSRGAVTSKIQQSRSPSESRSVSKQRSITGASSRGNSKETASSRGGSLYRTLSQKPKKFEIAARLPLSRGHDSLASGKKRLLQY